jgi:hypothetical protein
MNFQDVVESNVTGSYARLRLSLTGASIKATGLFRPLALPCFSLRLITPQLLGIYLSPRNSTQITNLLQTNTTTKRNKRKMCVYRWATFTSCRLPLVHPTAGWILYWCADAVRNNKGCEETTWGIQKPERWKKCEECNPPSE